MQLKQSIKRLITTWGYVILLCLIWYGLELFFYGEVQERGVDTIMMLLIVPLIYKSTKPFIDIKIKAPSYEMLKDQEKLKYKCYDCPYKEVKNDAEYKS